MALKAISIQDGYGLKDKHSGAPPLTTFTVTFKNQEYTIMYVQYIQNGLLEV